MRKNISHMTYTARRPLTYAFNTNSNADKIQIIQIKQTNYGNTAK